MVNALVLHAQGVTIGVGNRGVGRLVAHLQGVGQAGRIGGQFGGDDLAPADDFGQGGVGQVGLDIVHQVHAVGGQVRPYVGLVHVLDVDGVHRGPCLGAGHKRGPVVAVGGLQVYAAGFGVFLHGRIEDVTLAANGGRGPHASEPVAAEYRSDGHAAVSENVGCRCLGRADPVGQAVWVVGDIPHHVVGGVAGGAHQGDEQRGLIPVVAPAGQQGGRSAVHRAKDGDVLDVVVDIVKDEFGVMLQGAGQGLDLDGGLGLGGREGGQSA